MRRTISSAQRTGSVLDNNRPALDSEEVGKLLVFVNEVQSSSLVDSPCKFHKSKLHQHELE